MTKHCCSVKIERLGGQESNKARCEKVEPHTFQQLFPLVDRQREKNNWSQKSLFKLRQTADRFNSRAVDFLDRWCALLFKLKPKISVNCFPNEISRGSWPSIPKSFDLKYCKLEACRPKLGLEMKNNSQKHRRKNAIQKYFSQFFGIFSQPATHCEMHF